MSGNCRKLVFPGLFVAVSLGSFPVWAARVTAIDFMGSRDPNLIDIQTDGPVTYDRQMNSLDRQLILDLQGATGIATSAARPIDTSSFDSPVSMISPYVPNGSKDTVRVVVQLRDNADPNLSPEVSQNGNLIRVSIPRGADGSGMNASSMAEPGMGATDFNPPPPGESATLPAGFGGPNPASTSTDGTSPVTVDGFIQSKESQQFTGRPITLQVREVEVADVFQLISEASGFNIILGDDVKGKLSLSLVDVPWDQALDVVLNTLRLGAERNNNILRVLTLENLAKEKVEQLRAKRSQQVIAPRVTRVFQVNYANLTEMEKTISGLLATLNAQASSGGGPQDASSVVAGKVMSDSRTNSLIVNDTLENIERIRKLLEILDVQTPQVMIEGKVVEASEDFSKTFNGSLGIGRAGSTTASLNPDIFGSANGGNATPTKDFFGATGTFTGTDAFGYTKNAGGLGVSMMVGTIRVNALLNIGESENKIKVVSSPKAMVLNKTTANIVQSTPIAIPTLSTINGVTTTTYTTQQANLSLDVTPTVANDGSVLLDLTLTRDVPVTTSGQAAVANRKIKTTVLVESGSTLVLGGIFTMQNTETTMGFPILRKIPIIGWFFGNDTSSSEKRELFFFITPQVINPKKAGFST